MEHESTVITFRSKDKVTKVEYTYQDGEYSKHLIATVYVNNEMVHVFEKLPSTRTENPSKTQAKEIIAQAMKEIKKPQAKTRNVLIEKSKK
jgi:hypothetical protein